MDNIMGEQGAGVDLDLALFQLGEELAAAVLVVTQKRVAVDQGGTGRDTLIVDFVMSSKLLSVSAIDYTVTPPLDASHIACLSKQPSVYGHHASAE